MTVRSSPDGRTVRPSARVLRSPLQLLVDLTILAPIGVATALVEESPQLVERIRQQLLLARFVGKMSVTYGADQIRRRVEPNGGADTRPVGPAVEVAEVDQAEATASSTRTTTRGADALVLPDYDHLPAAHIVSKLASLDQVERDAVEQYELAHRHRRTILGRLEQLRDA